MELLQEFFGILEKQTKIVDQLSEMTTDKNSLIDKNIVNSDELDDAPARLSPKEKRRLDEASSIFISKFLSLQSKQKTPEKSPESPKEKPTIRTLAQVYRDKIETPQKPAIVNVAPKPVSNIVNQQTIDASKVENSSRTNNITNISPKNITNLKEDKSTINNSYKQDNSKINTTTNLYSKLDSTQDRSPSDDSRISSNQRTRFNDIASIFVSKFFEYQKKNTKDTSEKTLITKLDKTPKLDKTQSQTKPLGKTDDKSDGFLTKFLGLGAIGVFLKKSFKFLFPQLSALIGRVITNLKNLILYPFRALREYIKESISKSLNFIGKNLKSGVSKIFSSLGRAINTSIDSLLGSDIFKNIISKFQVVVNGFTDTLKKMINPQTPSKVIPTVVDGAKSLVKPIENKIAKSSFGQSVMSGLKSIGSSVGNVYTKTTQGLKSAGKSTIKTVKSAGKAVSKFATEESKALVTKAVKPIITNSGGMFKFMGKLSKVPVIGPAIQAGFTAYEIKDLKQQYKDKKISLEELQQKSGKSVIKSVAATVGTVGGAALAGTLGSIVPFAGTAIGGLLGAIGGGLLGDFLGGLITDYVIPEKYTKTIGAFVTGTTPPKEEMQDFIIKGDKVMPFSNKDEIMGIKSGGAINEFLKGAGRNRVDNSMDQLERINIQANQYLQAIAHNTALMVQNLKNPVKQGSPIIINKSSNTQPSSKSLVPVYNNRDGYGSSPYSLA